MRAYESFCATTIRTTCPSSPPSLCYGVTSLSASAGSGEAPGRARLRRAMPASSARPRTVSSAPMASSGRVVRRQSTTRGPTRRRGVLGRMAGLGRGRRRQKRQAHGVACGLVSRFPLRFIEATPTMSASAIAVRRLDSSHSWRVALRHSLWRSLSPPRTDPLAVPVSLLRIGEEDPWIDGALAAQPH
jgi:uncharacterized protein (DUF1684 family)